MKNNMANWNVAQMPDVITAEKIQILFNEECPVLFLVSGGSALSVLNVATLRPHAAVTMAVMDERYTTDPARSNLMQVEKTVLYKTLLENGGQYISAVPHDGELMDAWCARYEGMIRTWRTENPAGKMVALFGMGNDAHTAGIFPQVFPVLPGEQWFHSYNVPPEVHPETMRMTITPHFIKNEVDAAIGYILGTDKAAVYAQAQQIENATKAPVLLWDEVAQTEVVSDVPLPV